VFQTSESPKNVRITFSKIKHLEVGAAVAMPAAAAYEKSIRRDFETSESSKNVRITVSKINDMGVRAAGFEPAAQGG
jgi:hypothetical protein